MDYAKVNAAIQRMLEEARDFQKLANELPLRVRNKVMRRMQPDYQDPIYAPWGGLFPHPRIKKEGW